MTNTNESIIMNARLELLAQGVLQPTGRTIEIENNVGERIRVPEPEEIHTFNAWRAAGYYIRRGEHAIVRLNIWNHTAPRTQTVITSEGSEIEAEDRGHFYHKQSCFFAAHQVEPAHGKLTNPA